MVSGPSDGSPGAILQSLSEPVNSLEQAELLVQSLGLAVNVCHRYLEKMGVLLVSAQGQPNGVTCIFDGSRRGEAEPTSSLSGEAQRWTPLHSPSVKTALVPKSSGHRRGPTCPSSQPSLSSPLANPKCAHSL